MTARRILGSGPAGTAPIGAAQADLLDDLPGVRLPDLAELRARGVLGPRTARTPAARRVLGAGSHPDTGPSDAQEQPPTAGRPAVDVAVLRTDLEALGLTAEQLGYLSRAGQHLAALRKDANRRAHRAATGSAPGAQNAADAPRAHREDDQRAHQPHQPGHGHSPGAHR